MGVTMKKLIYILFTLFVITNVKMTVQANDYQAIAEVSDSNIVDLGFDDNFDELDSPSSINFSLIIFIFIILYIIQGCIFGDATHKIIKNKGYNENWFWWGFFFSIIAMLVALSKPELHNHGELDTIELLEKYKKLLDNGTITQEEFEEKKKQLLEKSNSQTFGA